MDWLTALIGRGAHHLLAAAHDPTLVVDARGTLRFVNDRVVDVSGHPRHAVLGRHVRELVPDWELIDPAGPSP
ncbi:PAS domain-containing protein, partial [Nocardioides sp.]|uniref:PAS domain-containing protein n=1 Tax=Nocardioides sp. TaxID=35761 RepID=UPI001A23111B